MNPIDEQLDRLWRAARQTPAENLAPPFGLEARVLAAWRESSASAGFWDSSVLVRALIGSAVIAAVCLVSALTTTATNTTPFAETMQLSDSTLTSEESL